LEQTRAAIHRLLTSEPSLLHEVADTSGTDLGPVYELAPRAGDRARSNASPSASRVRGKMPGGVDLRRPADDPGSAIAGRHLNQWRNAVQAHEITSAV
jgi:hypothetical protein